MAQPEFAAEVTQDQLALLTPEVAIVVEGPDGAAWAARTGETDRSDPNVLAVTLIGNDGGPVCADACSAVPVEGDSRWSARAVTVPRQEGPQVPVGAIRSRADTSLYVQMADGSQRDVTVQAAAQGLAVVSGLEVGERIVIPRAPSP